MVSGSRALAMGMGRLNDTSSAPVRRTSTASALTPALASTLARGTPVHVAHPTPPVPQGPPLAVLPNTLPKKLRQFPAHSRYATMERLGISFSSAKDSSSGWGIASPSMRSRNASGSRIGVVVAWLRTKNSSFGVKRPSRLLRRVSRLVGWRMKGVGSFTHGLSSPDAAGACPVASPVVPPAESAPRWGASPISQASRTATDPPARSKRTK